jgi:4-hydroxybenzoate polyprenyltransferase
LLVFIRASLYDIRDIQGDAVVGRETIPIIIGKRWTQRVVLILVLVSAVLLGIGSAVSILPSLGWWLLVIPIYALGSLGLYRSRFIFQGVPFEVVVDFEFVLAGLIAVGWYLAVR